MPKMWLVGLAAGLGVLAAYFLFWPVPISPEQWTPPDPPALTGAFEPNEALVATDRLEVGLGPESVAINEVGVVYCGLENGSIVRWAEGAGEAEVLLNIGGRPLGMAFNTDGNLIVCDLYGRLRHGLQHRRQSHRMRLIRTVACHFRGG